jgi:DNA-binding NarL/FixJ family response regulator
MSIRVLLCDDHPVWRAGLRAVLEAEDDIAVVADLGDGYEAVRHARALRPDVVLVDTDLPRLHGLEVARQLAGPQVSDPMRVMVVAAGTTGEAVESVRAGASGYLLKDLPSGTLVSAVRAIAAGELVLAPAAARQLFDHFAVCTHGPWDQPPDLHVLRDLTRRERSVLRLLAGGLTNAGIANALGLSVTTVKTHMSHILCKLKLQDRAQAVAIAYETGFVQPRPRSVRPQSRPVASRAGAATGLPGTW